ncbi:23S rRNA (guanosine(2251)-2'-O)-methyltransferase RlmB [Curvivirga aplysinae]|uniref:23S rRNA (guanosine(2251)-2'-O)-methyltransferase RlmB n=1 Tax=Curvivirga aplysinae TaxID=2529852 RepID=UPI0012BBEC29|nr:23S rRNA (guanosine(2251)-2'-O)-methyltransferase RlmB [Curvivirga aplysinae]MTI08445.1 23S rRNA (guanosine(2251)-2'-O)-methyltransferase RlmB [Curvivirga aplysinae]
MAQRRKGHKSGTPKKRDPQQNQKKSNQRSNNDSIARLPRAGGNQLWLYGNHPITAALENRERKIEAIAVTPAAQDRYMELCTKRNIPMVVTNREELDRLFGEDAIHQGVGLLVQRLNAYALEDLLFGAEDDDVYLILDQVTDPHNVGAILRSAAVFGAKAVILPERNAPEESAVLAKSASGAVESTPLIYVGNLARALDKIRDAGFWTVGFAGEAEAELQEVTLTGKIALVMGAEGPGMRRLTRENCDTLARIPMAENVVGSLNVSNAAAIALYATKAQRSSS